MKNITLIIASFLLFSCNKENFQLSKKSNSNEKICEDIDTKKLIGNWKYLTIKNKNDANPKPLQSSVFQYLTINKDSSRYAKVPFLSYKWTYLDCSIIRFSSKNGEKDIKVKFIEKNKMHWTSLEDGTEWELINISSKKENNNEFSILNKGK